MSNIATIPDGATPTIDHRLAGIGGWLILPAIGFVLTPLIALMSLVFLLRMLPLIWAAGHGRIVMLDMLLILVLLILTVSTALRFFRKKADAPRRIIALLIIAVASDVLLLIASMAAGTDDDLALGATTGLLRDGISAAIWIPYFRMSKRVKATFVN